VAITLSQLNTNNAQAMAVPTPIPIVEQLRAKALSLGFASLGVSDIDLKDASLGLRAWLEAGYHGAMDYMARHEHLRGEPATLHSGTVCAVMVTMNYTPTHEHWAMQSWQTMADENKAYVARYAVGRDYHKVVRTNLQKLADFAQKIGGEIGYRVFCDSAPVMEVELASKAGLGWRGKNTLLLSREQGSMFFIGTLYIDMKLPTSEYNASAGEHCGTCTRCLDVCPTKAFDGPYRLDARKCISYLTIENKGPIPMEYRKAMGNRIYGCDDCQLVCPWNKYAQAASHPDFAVRNLLDSASLMTLFAWTENEFNERMAGSAIYRIGYWRWLRNIAVGLGNGISAGSAKQGEICDALNAVRASLDHTEDEQALVIEHIDWALAQSQTLQSQ
jgi:epoxyqueuosine reductase